MFSDSLCFFLFQLGKVYGWGVIGRIEANEDSPFPLELPEPDFEALAVAKRPDGLEYTLF